MGFFVIMYAFLKKIKSKFSQKNVSSEMHNFSDYQPQTQTPAPIITRRNKFTFNRKLVLPTLGIVAGLVLTIIVGGRLINALTGNSKANTPIFSSNDRPMVPQAIAQQELNKVFNFSLKDQTGKEISKITYKIMNATLQDEIIVQGRRNVAVQGRVFLIMNLKIDNNYQQGIRINSRDYVRLKVNNSSEFLAPEIHNDPVEVQAISTKYTRIGFAINETDKNLVLQTGEINGPKETITLDLR